MSLRCMTREPAKRMLVFFNCDETTSVLETNKVKKVLNGNRLEKGASVLVAYGKDEFQAQVVKLHDDPSVLRQAEIEFLSRFDSAHDELADKENNPKRQKLSPDKTIVDKTIVDKTKVNKPKGSKAGKQPKTISKKIISIDAEALPSAESQPPTQKPIPENKPGSLTFLNVEEQLKVQKILSEYEKGDGKEVGVQTEQNVVQPHHCNCQNAVLTKFELLEEKVNTIISLLTTAESAKKLEEQEELFNCDELFVVGNDSLEEEQILLRSIAETIGAAAKQTPPAAEQTPPAAEQTPPTAELPVSGQCSGKTFSIFPLSPPQTTARTSTASLLHTIPSLLHTIPSGVFEETFKKSSSIANYAKNLVFSLFSKEELIGSNCTGAYQKKPLEKDYRMTLITDATFKKYSVDDKKKSWSLCRKAIDLAIRKLRFQC